MTKPTTFEVPGEVVAAIATGRPQLLQHLLNSLQANEPLPLEHVAGIVQALADQIGIRFQIEQELSRMEGYVERLLSANRQLIQTFRKAEVEATKAAKEVVEAMEADADYLEVCDEES